MPDEKFTTAVENIIARDQRYHPDSYDFVQSALIYTQEKIKQTRGKIGHVSGQELLEGIKEYALNEFASMATMVFAEWGITRCEDFAEIVFNMVEEGMLSKTDQDSKEDFRKGFDFYEAFTKPFLPPSKR
ncbi:MAG: hypothetical protein J5773_06365 [Verrucomicrobia bacterium]|nr:hypothetical protein [Verrucomicrobiota bacterium]MBO4714943.1 hypothetical protein [Verrucomicrobiota bacterium]MBQ7589277.1 hypothetical protein [Verrucomicrobiota bacterium]MBR5978321.1 hypothetical protein [Verrucomicrobiota bacterium]MBR6460634.1 hypothetical protein [Verrucomicrobiota bacterium]